MNRQTLKTLQHSEKTKQVSLFTKSVEAVIIAKVIKMISAKEADLNKYDQRSPAVIFAKAIKRTIGAAGGDKIGKAFFAYSAMKELSKAVNPAIKEAEEAEGLNEQAKEIISFLDSVIVDPQYADLIPLINESKGTRKYKVLDKINRKEFMKELIK